MRFVSIGVLWVGMTGCFAAEAPPPERDESVALCGADGGDGLPLAEEGCRGHVLVEDLGIDLAGARGLRPQLEGFHYLAARGAGADVRLLLPRVTPGRTGSDECASLKLWDGDLYSSTALGGSLEVEIESRGPDAVAGTFQAIVCASADPSSSPECVGRAGRFAARIEADNGPAPAGGGCAEAAECVGPLLSSEAEPGRCGLVPICQDGVCTTQ